MRHINTRQIYNHVWHLEVTDGHNIQWTAVLSGSILDIRRGTRTSGKTSGEATVKAKTEGEAIGIALQLVFNWDQDGPVSNEILDERWNVTDAFDLRFREKRHKAA